MTYVWTHNIYIIYIVALIFFFFPSFFPLLLSTNHVNLSWHWINFFMTIDILNSFISHINSIIYNLVEKENKKIKTLNLLISILKYWDIDSCMQTLKISTFRWKKVSSSNISFFLFFCFLLIFIKWKIFFLSSLLKGEKCIVIATKLISSIWQKKFCYIVLLWTILD